MTDLVVELYGQHIGTLSGNRDRFDFAVEPGAIERFGIGSSVLSFAIPFTPAPRPDDVGRRRNFFEEVLAEGRVRTRLSLNAKLDDDNTIALLARYGRDVAGALQIWDPSVPGEPRTPSAVPITPAQVVELLSKVRTAPLGNTTVRHKTSLAGVQDKIVLALTEDGWAEPLDGFPSTHIIKPLVGDRRNLIFDEEYGARIARHLGLASFDTRIESFEGISALVIERYDREGSSRIHQEDFNQILGLRGDQKYQAHGGSTLRAVADSLRQNMDAKSVEGLLRMTTLSIAVGNSDMHAKNISVVHTEDDKSFLAPMYDIVPQMHQPGLDTDFAFEVNGKYAHAEITRGDLVTEGASWGVRRPENIIDGAIASVAEFVASERPLPGAHHSLAADIAGFCRNLADGRGASERPGAMKKSGGSRRKDHGLGPTANGGNSGRSAENGATP